METFTTWTRSKINLPLTGLIDIVFLLLVFFLLTTNFMTDQGFDLKLPRSEKAPPKYFEEIIVVVDQGGLIHAGSRTMDLPALTAWLKDKLSNGSERPVVIKADRRLALGALVEVMDAAKEARAERLILATRKDEP